ncbi:hypothetical protein HOLleu_41666 [Holothuria leucospilota]|uniref:G-protein coupled receptors family 1 profile domain-containing protein n=1 Tax=Holothuria leucospilota TaxID=206669 RepID=A0A9Q0YEG5_HOLLE|nr:hypothetical protein HOLleu_41666 [Holothuria leucospilota]
MMEIPYESSLLIASSLPTITPSLKDGRTEVPHLCSLENPSWTAEQQAALFHVHRVRVAACYLALIANGILLLFQIKIKLFLRTYFVFGLSLTTADLTFSVCSFLKTQLWALPCRWPDSLLFNAVNTAGHFHAYVSVLLITVDRYLALVWDPLRYKGIASLKRYYVIFALSWCFSFLYSFVIRYFFPPGSYESSLEACILPSIVMVTCTFMYIKIYLATPLLPAAPGQENCRYKQSRKLLFAIMLILVASFVTSIPMSVFHFNVFLGRIRFADFENILMANIFYTLQIAIAVFNPIIYWWQVLLREIQPICGCWETKISR